MESLWRVLVMWHVIWLAGMAYILAIDLPHPESWADWCHDPHVSLPLYIVAEVVGVPLYVRAWLRRERKAKGIALLKMAIQLQAEGRHEAAEAAYREGCRLSGIQEMP
ncbi:MAG TPA: hypothetical protein VFA18_02440 [Gemmataceae bacterium]|nr:hypothetical protein [Gemmataceae bacterium]